MQLFFHIVLGSGMWLETMKATFWQLYLISLKWSSVAKLAKVKATLIAIKFAVEMGFHSLEIEGDVRNVVNALSIYGKNLSKISGFIAETQLWLHQCSNILVSWCNCTANVVAHSLVKHARHVDEFLMWLEECPYLSSYDVNVDLLFMNE